MWKKLSKHLPHIKLDTYLFGLHQEVRKDSEKESRIIETKSAKIILKSKLLVNSNDMCRLLKSVGAIYPYEP